MVQDYSEYSHILSAKKGGKITSGILFSKYVFIGLDCIDENIPFSVGNDFQDCAEYVAGDPCRCENRHVGQNCCASCKGKGRTINVFLSYPSILY